MNVAPLKDLLVEKISSLIHTLEETDRKCAEERQRHKAQLEDIIWSLYSYSCAYSCGYSCGYSCVVS